MTNTNWKEIENKLNANGYRIQTTCSEVEMSGTYSLAKVKTTKNFLLGKVIRFFGFDIDTIVQSSKTKSDLLLSINKLNLTA